MSYENFFKTARELRQQGTVRKTPPSQMDLSKGKKNMQQELQREEQDLRKKMKMKPRRAKARFPIVPILVLGAISTVLGWWSVDPELPDRILKHIDIQMMGAASAKEEQKSAKKTESKGEEPAKTAVASTTAANALKTGEGVANNEDFSHLEKLRERKEALDLREKELNELEEELQKQKVEIEARIKRLEEMRAQITTVLKDRVAIDQEKVMRLVETYSNMKPKQAAEILSGLDEDLAVEVVSKMKKKNAAEIMNLLEPAKARAISEKYAGYKAR